MELICTNGKRDSRKKFTSPGFCLPFTQTCKPWTDRFAHVKGKQPILTQFIWPEKKNYWKKNLRNCPLNVYTVPRRTVIIVSRSVNFSFFTVVLFGLQQFAKLCGSAIQKMNDWRSRAPPPSNVKEYSPWLFNFSSYYTHTLEIPGNNNMQHFNLLLY